MPLLPPHHSLALAPSWDTLPYFPSLIAYLPSTQPLCAPYQLAAFFTRLLRTLGHTQAHHGVLHVGACAHITAFLPELAHGVDGASVDTNLWTQAFHEGMHSVHLNKRLESTYYVWKLL